MQKISDAHIEEVIGKTVGDADPVKAVDGIQKFLKEHLETTEQRLTPRGVFRFKSHEEADEWIIKYGRVIKS